VGRVNPYRCVEFGLGTARATVRWTLVLLILLYASEPSLGQSISTDDVVEHLRARELAPQGRSLTFKVTRYQRDGQDTLPDHPESEEFLTSIDRFRCLYDSGSYRIDHTMDWPVDGDFSKYRLVYTWDGSEAHTTGYDRLSSEMVSIRVADAPPREHYMYEYSAAILQTPMQLPFGECLSVYLAENLHAGPMDAGHGSMRWVVWPPSLPQREIEVTVSSRDSTPSLTSVIARVFDRPREDSARKIIATSILEITQMDTGELVPKRATFTVLRHRGDGKSWSRSVIELIEDGPIDVALLTHPLAESGVEVADERYRIAYAVGDRILNLDGRALITHEPLAGDVGSELEYWVSNGRFAERPAADMQGVPLQWTGESGPTTGAGQFPSKIRYATGAVIALIAGLLIWRCRRGGMTHEPTK